MERQTKDGTFYKSVGPDEWEVVTRETTDGKVYKKVGQDEWSLHDVQNQEPESRRLEATGRAFIDSATLGYAPEIYAGTQQALETVGSNIPFFGDGETEDVYQSELDQYRQEDASLEAQHPNYSMAGNIAGYVVPGMGVAKGIKAGKAGLGLAKATGKWGALGAKSATLAGEGAVIGAAQRPSTDDDIINLKERFQSGLLEGAVGAAIPPVFKGIGAAGKAIGKIPKKALAVLGGVDDNTISAFLKDPDRYLKAASREKVEDTITNLVNDVNGKVKSGKLGVGQAKEGLSAIEKTIKEGLTEKHKVSSELLKKAQENLKVSYGAVEEGLKKTAPPTHLISEIDDSIRGLKDQVIKGSKESFEILDTIKKKPVPKDTSIVNPKNLDSYSRDKIHSLGLRIKNKKAALKHQRLDKGPYVTTSDSPFGVMPNYASKPTGVIGKPKISHSTSTSKSGFKAEDIDPLAWLDQKYNTTKKLIQKHKDQGLDLEINTSSDLLARGDYIEALPNNTKVNMYMLTGDGTIDRLIFPSNPSNKRLLDAVKRLRESGISVNKIHPTPESIIDAVGLERIEKNTGMKGLKNVKKMLSKITQRPHLKIVSEEIPEIQKRITQGKKQALELLEVKPEKLKKTEIKLKPIVLGLKRLIKEQGQRTNKPSKAAVKRISELLEHVESLSKDGKLSAVKAKKILQDIDADSLDWDSKKVAGSFSDNYTKSLKGARSIIDKQLKKEFGAYKQKMIEVAEDSELLGELSKKFGTPEKAMGRLKSIDKPKGVFDRDLLKKLEARTNKSLKKGEVKKDFGTPIKEYMDIQKTLGSKKAMREIKEGLPEYKYFQNASRAQKVTAAKKLPKYVREQVGKTGEKKAYLRAIKDFKEANIVKDKIKGWQESTVKSKIRSVMWDKSNARKQLLSLSKMADKDLVKMVDDLKVNEAFTKTFKMGSRNVNLMTGLIVGMIGYGPVGLALGVLLGGAVDMYGPRMTKSILKGLAKVKGVPTVKKLTAFKIPKKIAQELVDAFYGTSLVAMGDEIKRQKRISAKGVDKWAYRGFEKLKFSDIKENDFSPFKQFEDEMLTNPKLKKLLIEASEYSPGTIGFKKILNEAKQLMKEGK